MGNQYPSESKGYSKAEIDKSKLGYNDTRASDMGLLASNLERVRNEQENKRADHA
jgi:hypothetical protein